MSRYKKDRYDYLAEFLYNQTVYLENDVTTCRDNIYHCVCDVDNVDKLRTAMIKLDYHKELVKLIMELLHNSPDFR